MNDALLNLANLVQNQLLLLPGVNRVSFDNEQKLLTMEGFETINLQEVETLIFKSGYRMKFESITPILHPSPGKQLKSFVQLSIALYGPFPIMPFSRS